MERKTVLRTTSLALVLFVAVAVSRLNAYIIPAADRCSLSAGPWPLTPTRSGTYFENMS